MSRSVASTYALRSLGRYSRRTMLSMIGIGIGCAICLFQIAWVRGERTMMMNAAAHSGVGHLCVVPEGWRDTRSQKLRMPDWEEILRELRTQPEVAVATPRARTDALLAFGTRSTGVEMVGVDPATERKGNRLLRRVVSGRYLEPGERGCTIIGEAIADRFRVEVDDQLMVTVAGSDGDMRSAMLQIVGVVATGSRELDSILCHTSLEELATLSGFAGATEIAVTLNKPRKQLEPFIAELRTSLPPAAEALSWTELRPELEAGIKVDETWARLTVGIIMIVVFLGIASAQLAAALERRREFAVLSSLGMPASSLWRVMISEGILLGIAGSFVGLLIGLPITGWVARHGIDFGKLFNMKEMTMSKIMIDPVFYADFGWWLVPLAFGLSLSATLLSSLYPAWYAIRTDPATALRVEH